VQLPAKFPTTSALTTCSDLPNGYMVEICGNIVAQSHPFWSSRFSMGWTELERKREREKPDNCTEAAST